MLCDIMTSCENMEELEWLNVDVIEVYRQLSSQKHGIYRSQYTIESYEENC